VLFQDKRGGGRSRRGKAVREGGGGREGLNENKWNFRICLISLFDISISPYLISFYFYYFTFFT
jgi:hypothetical protein